MYKGGEFFLELKMINTKAFFDTDTNTVTYLIWDEDSSEALVIDPVLDYEPHAAHLETRSADNIIALLRNKGLQLTWVLDTHVHADHFSAGHYLREQTGAKLGIGAHVKNVQSYFGPIYGLADGAIDHQIFDALFEDSDTIQLGEHTVKSIYTPGHTAACVTYLIADMAFVGDTLFMPDYGTARTDFPGGDAATLYKSIQNILSLPDETRIMVGHDYRPKGRVDYAWESTVADQRKNIHLRGKSEAMYVDMRNARDATLSVPRLILPALQVNIHGGKLPPVANDGNTYLTIPLNRI